MIVIIGLRFTIMMVWSTFMPSETVRSYQSLSLNNIIQETLASAHTNSADVSGSTISDNLSWIGPAIFCPSINKRRDSPGLEKSLQPLSCVTSVLNFINQEVSVTCWACMAVSPSKLICILAFGHSIDCVLDVELAEVVAEVFPTDCFTTAFLD